MKIVNDNIKNALKQPTTQRKGKILVNGNYYEVFNVEYYADAYNEGNVIGNAIASQLDFDLPYIEKFDSFKYFDGVWTGNEYEYVDFGTFTVFDEKDQDEFNKHITAFDNLIKFNAIFEDKQDYPKTLFQELQNICNQAGIELENKNIINGNFIVENNQFVAGENLKTVLKNICGISGTYAVIKNDKLKLQLYSINKKQSLGKNEISLQDVIKDNTLSYNIKGKGEQETEPSPDYPSEIKTVKGIRNLFDKDNANILKAYLNSGKLVADENTYLAYIPCEHNTTYTIQKIVSSRFVIYGTIEKPIIGVSGVVYGDTIGDKIVVKTNGTTNYLMIMYYKPNIDTLTEEQIRSSIMVEEGPIAHGYVPYGSWLKTNITNENLFDGLFSQGAINPNNGELSPDKQTWAITTTNLIKVKPNTTYRFFCKSEKQTLIDRIATFDKNKKFISRSNSLNTNIIETDSDTYFIRFNIYYANGITPDDVGEPLFKEGTEETEYKPHQKQEVLIDMNKPNLFDKNLFIQGTFDNPSSMNRIVSLMHKVSKGYTFTAINKNTSKYAFSIGFTSSNVQSGNTFINETGWITDSIKSVSANNEGYMFIQIKKIDNSVLIPSEVVDTDFIIYEGYEPYYELASINDTKDNLEVVSGVLTKRIGKAVLDGSEDWKYISGNAFYIATLFGTYDDSKLNIIADKFIGLPRNNIDESKNYISLTANGNVRLNYLNATSVTELTTWLSENPVTVYYILAEPEIIQLTPTNVPLFEGYNKVTLVEDLETETSIEYNYKISEKISKNQHEPIDWKRKTYGINQVILGMSNVEGEYVIREDKEDIAKNGVHKLVINDNYFSYTQNKRENLIDELFNQVKGFGYIPYELKGEWLNYVDIGDKVIIDDIETIILRINGKSPKSLESTMSAPAIIDSSIEYIDNTNSIENRMSRTEIVVDKQNQTIKSLASKIVDVSEEKNGTNRITLENAHEGTLHYLSIKGNISLLFPSSQGNLYGYPLAPSEKLTPNETLTPSIPIYKDNQTLYPSTELFSKSNVLLIDEEEYKLDIDFLNYLDNTNCDEFIYEDGKCKIIRRVGVDEKGELYKLENEVIEPKNDIILNVKSNSIIRMKSFENAMFKVVYLLENEYTNYFATNVEVKSEIKQTADEINLSVSKKTDKEEVVSIINQSPEQITLKSNRLVVESDNFKLDGEGKITATAGEIAGFEIDKTDGFKYKIYAPYDYNDDDLQRINDIYLGKITPTQNDYERLDINKDGVIDLFDAIIIQWYILYGITSQSPGAFSIQIPKDNKLLTTKTGYSDAYGNLISGFTYDSVVSQKGKFTGNITCETLTQTSLESNKKNFEKLEDALSIIKNTDIYKYNMKSEDDNTKKHIGFVIGDEYNYSKEITSENNDGVDTYSMVSVCFKAIKEQQKIIEQLTEEIKLLKENDK